MSATEESNSDFLLLLQLVDSGFPTGSFAHSSALEAAVASGLVANRAQLERFIVAHIDNTAATQIVALRQAHTAGLTFCSGDSVAALRALARVDEWLQASTTSSVARAASVSLGRAFIDTIDTALVDRVGVRSACASLRSSLPHRHHCACLGFLFAVLGLSFARVAEAHLFSAARTVISAAVRLSLVSGAREGQRLQAAVAPVIARARRQWDQPHRPLNDSSGAFLLDLLQQSHARLSQRMFVT